MAAIRGNDNFIDCDGNGKQVLKAMRMRLGVEHHMKLGTENQDTDPCKHPINDRWRYSAENLTKLEYSRKQLEQTCKKNNRSKHFNAILLNKFPNNDCKPGSWSTHL